MLVLVLAAVTALFTVVMTATVSVVGTVIVTVFVTVLTVTVNAIMTVMETPCCDRVHGAGGGIGSDEHDLDRVSGRGYDGDDVDDGDGDGVGALDRVDRDVNVMRILTVALATTVTVTDGYRDELPVGALIFILPVTWWPGSKRGKCRVASLPPPLSALRAHFG